MIPARLLLDDEVVDEPADLYRTLLRDAPVWRVPGTDVVVVSSFAAVSEAVTRTADFSSNLRGLLHRGADGAPAVLPFEGGPGTDVLATADPPAHATHRRSVFPELVAKRMSALRAEVEALVDAHLDEALAAQDVEFMGQVANAVPIRVVSRLIGFRSEDPDQLLAAAFASTEMLAAAQPVEAILDAMARTAEVMYWIDEQLQAALTDGADGILGVLASAIGAGDLAASEGLVMLHTLLSAGGESTTSLLGNAVHLLATRPDLQAQLRDDPELLPAFVEEVLRLESPFRHHLRHVPADTELCGVPVPAGATVLLLWAAANRDPAEFDRPEEVVLDRAAPRHHVGFGRGIHLCVGAPLARLEAEVVLSRLLARTASIEPAPDRRPERERSLMVRRFRSLPLRVEVVPT